jgi:hypothetical protein
MDISFITAARHAPFAIDAKTPFPVRGSIGAAPWIGGQR